MTRWGMTFTHIGITLGVNYCVHVDYLWGELNGVLRYTHMNLAVQPLPAQRASIGTHRTTRGCQASLR